MLDTTVREREAEIAVLDAAALEAAAGEGAVVLLEGRAGIGKTVPLRAARERSAASGLQVLRATASPLERDFPFGVVRRLLDPVLAAADAAERERLLSGAAARRGRSRRTRPRSSPPTRRTCSSTRSTGSPSRRPSGDRSR